MAVSVVVVRGLWDSTTASEAARSPPPPSPQVNPGSLTLGAGGVGHSHPPPSYFL